MKKYYVYCHCFKDTNEIFYIGKGTGRRLVSKRRNPLWLYLTSSREYYSMKIRDFLEENEAIDFENELLLEFNTAANIVQKSNKVKRVSYNYIKEIVDYDETSPTFLRYRVPRANGAIKAGSVAGSFDSEGYGQIYMKDRLYKIHRLIYCLCSKEDLDSNLIIDHIDGNKSNNNIINLRLTTISENARNVRWEISKPSNTGERGISFRGDSYRVLWMQDGKQKERSFSFKRSGRTKEEAFVEAISFRNSLIESGHINIVSGTQTSSDEQYNQR